AWRPPRRARRLARVQGGPAPPPGGRKRCGVQLGGEGSWQAPWLRRRMASRPCAAVVPFATPEMPRIFLHSSADTVGHCPRGSVLRAAWSYVAGSDTVAPVSTLAGGLESAAIAAALAFGVWAARSRGAATKRI